MSQQINIQSYFSIETDLAGEMRHWQEFVEGEGYSVDLIDSKTNQLVSVRYAEEGEDRYVIVTSALPSELLDKVIGKVIIALSKNSDYLMVYNRCKTNL